jgi:hypothetical protein
MDPKGKAKVTEETEKEILCSDTPNGREIVDSKWGKKKKDKKKKKRIKKIVYYNSDTSLSSPKEEDDSSSSKKMVKRNYSKTSFNYLCIPYNANAHLLSIPLGKPPHFDGEDYSWRSHKIRNHLFSLHPSIWDVVENGMHVVDSDDKNYNAICMQQMIHKITQATTVLLDSLCRDEYNKVSGLDNAKEIWDTLKISHEGNDITMITKMELVEGELGRFAMKRGEEPTETYNMLETLVNKIRSYGSTRWTDHDVVRLMLRSFTIIDHNLVNLICENPRYTKMLLEEILGKFVSGHMMANEATYIDDIANEPLPQHYESQPIALKATSNKYALPDKVAQIEAVGLKDEGMAPVIKHFKTALKGHKDHPNKSKSRESIHASSAVSPIFLLINVLIIRMTRTKTRKERRRRRSSIGRRVRRTSAMNGIQTALHQTLTTRDLPHPPSTSLPSSSTSATHASWLRRRRYMYVTLPSTLLQVMRIPMLILIIVIFLRDYTDPNRIKSMNWLTLLMKR